jgi:adenine-specific DNA-methyltransferase
LYTPKNLAEQSEFNLVELNNGERLTASEATKKYGNVPPNARYFTAQNLASSGYTESCTFDYKLNGKAFPPPRGRSWKTHKQGMDRLALARRLYPLQQSLRYVYFYDDFPAQEISNLWVDTFAESNKIYVVQTATDVITRCLLMTTDPGDLILDPTCGSGTAAYAAEQCGRRWITIDTSRVAIALARTRLMAGRFPYYLLADSPDGQMRESELSGKIPPNESKTEGDIRKGFVYRRVPHVTLKSIANNPDIKEDMEKADLDAAIARHADQEMLYDQPCEDAKRLRVAGPFTVESLSPHRILSTDNQSIQTKNDALISSSDQFETVVIDNLKAAGVQNTIKGERLKFDRLEPYAGSSIHAAGEYSELGKTKRVAVCIGPENGTVGPELLKEAAKEAVQGVGFDLLIVCGLAFDPHVSEEAKRYGKLKVLITRMNPDLSMGGELLKKTGSGNLFMVFGEPDIDLKKSKEGEWSMDIKGVDVYDPTTGQIRSHSTDDIACWFIDTDYNGESFFVRHAYFCGADEPYEKLKKALKADVDETAWSSIYSTKSRPFDTPKTGKIAVKVINHYGDEVLKVYDLKK